MIINSIKIFIFSISCTILIYSYISNKFMYTAFDSNDFFNAAALFVAIYIGATGALIIYKLIDMWWQPYIRLIPEGQIHTIPRRREAFYNRLQNRIAQLEKEGASDAKSRQLIKLKGIPLDELPLSFWDPDGCLTSHVSINSITFNNIYKPDSVYAPRNGDGLYEFSAVELDNLYNASIAEYYSLLLESINLIQCTVKHVAEPWHHESVNITHCIFMLDALYNKLQSQYSDTFSEEAAQIHRDLLKQLKDLQLEIYHDREAFMDQAFRYIREIIKHEFSRSFYCKDQYDAIVDKFLYEVMHASMNFELSSQQQIEIVEFPPIPDTDYFDYTGLKKRDAYELKEKHDWMYRRYLCYRDTRRVVYKPDFFGDGNIYSPTKCYSYTENWVRGRSSINPFVELGRTEDYIVKSRLLYHNMFKNMFNELQLQDQSMLTKFYKYQVNSNRALKYEYYKSFVKFHKESRSPAGPAPFSYAQQIYHVCHFIADIFANGGENNT